MKIKDNFLMVSNYNADISWILDYTNDYIIYDRSDTDEWIKPFDPKKVIKVPNIGWDIYDKLTYIIENYDNLPDIVLLTKGNLFKYISREEFDTVCNNEIFTLLLTKNHTTKRPVSFYDENGIFNEINNSWYLKHFPAKYFNSFNEFLRGFPLKPPRYLAFAPGSNYIVSKEDIQKHPKRFYEKLRKCVEYAQLPGEAQIVERFMHTMWTTDKRFEPEMITLAPKNFLIRFFQKIRGLLLRKVLDEMR